MFGEELYESPNVMAQVLAWNNKERSPTYCIRCAINQAQ